MMNTLPQDFLVGAATAAHQVEGNNIHSDYWAMEHMKYGNFNEPSLDAVDHYNRYEEDNRMFSLSYRTTPVHSLDQTEFFRFRREQRSHRWIMNIIRKA